MVKDVLTPSDDEEHPSAEPVGGVGHHHGRVQVTALTKHPEEVCHMEVVIGCCHQPAPHLGSHVKHLRSHEAL